MFKTEIAAAPGKSTIIEVSDGVLTAATVQDCDPIAEYTKALHNEGLHGSSDMKHAGFIPDVFIEKYCNDNGVTFHEFMANREHIRRVINDPALKAFRVWPGVV